MRARFFDRVDDGRAFFAQAFRSAVSFSKPSASIGILSIVAIISSYVLRGQKLPRGWRASPQFFSNSGSAVTAYDSPEACKLQVFVAFSAAIACAAASDPLAVVK
jgi:hypothetical protein